MALKNWTPEKIKYELDKAGVTQSDIARQANRSVTQVGRVIRGQTSEHIRNLIAQAINTDVKLIWPEYYLKGVISPTVSK